MQVRFTAVQETTPAKDKAGSNCRNKIAKAKAGDLSNRPPIDDDDKDEQSFIGVGLRQKHYSYLQNRPQTKVKWFEVITENFLHTQGRPKDILKIICDDYPISFHGVSLSIAGPGPLDTLYLKNLKNLLLEFRPFLVSDHLCWTGKAQANLHNLLPFPFTKESLNFLSERIDFVQNFLGRKMAFENLSAYFNYKKSTLTEWEFTSELLRRSGCDMLLDLNNVYVNSINHDFNPYTYIDALPVDSIAEVHLAGFSDLGDFLFDTHSCPVYPQVWELYQYALQKGIRVPILVEWDENIPDFSQLENEALKAQEIWSRTTTTRKQ